MQKRLLAALLIIFIALTAAGSALAQTAAGLSMTVQPAFGGDFKYGRWLPIFVTLENSGSDLKAELRARITSQSGQLNFVVPAELPAGSHKRFTLYTLPNNFSRSIKVDLVQDDTELTSQTVEISSVPNDRYFIGVIGDETANLSVLSSINLPGRRDNPELLNITLAEIPDRAEGLTLFDALILNAVDTGQLSPNQQSALQQWVVSGGRLVLGGGSRTALTLSGLPDALQPVTLSGQQELSALPALEQYADRAIPMTGPFLLAATKPVEAAATLLSETVNGSDQLPLIVEHKLGKGHVDFIALDLTSAPFSDWAGVTDFTERLLSPGAAWPNNLPPDIAPHQMRDSQITSALSNLPTLDLPSIRFLGILLIGYIILVGPLNYLLLRWLDRLAWAWITIPLLTLAFSGMAYGVSYQLRGSDIIVNQLSVMELSQDGQVTDTETYVGIFSPSRRAYNVEVSGRPLLRPLGEGYYDPWSGEVRVGNMSVVQSEPAQVSGLTVNQWSIQSFVAETALPDPPQLEAQLDINRERLTGQLINQSSNTLEDVVIIFNMDFQKLGNIPPGQTIDIDFDFTTQRDVISGFGSYMIYQEELNQPGLESSQINFKQRVLDSTIFNQSYSRDTGGVTVLGWYDDSPLTVTLQGQEITSQKTSLLYGQLPVAFDETDISLPPAFSHSESLLTTGQTGTCDYGTGIQGYYIDRGTAEVKLTLPDSIRQVEPARLDLYVQTDGGVWGELPKIELYDNTSSAWITLEQPQFGQNPITQPQHYYDPAAASLRVRLSRDDNAQGGSGCVFVSLAFEGERS
ncbi:MAG: hypothetical protein KDJ52_24185 [Anaerolineae bacterium]|nr:hypothetical protein [Anaerolineae bacterium]